MRPSEEEPTEATFCIGSNCGDREENVRKGLRWLGKILTGLRHSTIYATPDCHGGQREYLNAVAIGNTEIMPSELERLCKEFEFGCGRDAVARASGDVPLDVDLVVYANDVIRQKDYGCEFFLKGLRQLSQR